MKSAVAYNNLNGGIWSPLLRGRTDLARYPTAATDSLNMLPLTLGPVTRRPGTHDIAATNENAAAQLGRFVFNDDQAYILEWSPGWLRFIQRGGLIMAGGSPYRIASPYGSSHLSAIRGAQSADVVYLACRGVRPHKLSRYGLTNWTLTPVVFRDGPYRDPWPDMGSVTISGTNASFSAPVLDAGWQGQCLRIKVDGAWYWKRIVSVVNATAAVVVTEAGAEAPPILGPEGDTVTDTVHADGTNGETVTLPAAWAPMVASGLLVTWDTQKLTAGTDYTLDEDGVTLRWTNPLPPLSEITIVNLRLATREISVTNGVITDWRAPAWGGSRGWPATVALFEERTWWAGTIAEPLSLWASVTGDYEVFSPTEKDASVLDDNGLYLIAADQEVSEIRWLMPGQTLAMGTAGGEYLVRASELGEALTAANVNIRPETTEGTADVEPLRIDAGIVFVRRGGQGVHVLTYDADQDGLITPDLAQLAEHLLTPGVTGLAWCRLPFRLLWCLLGDGTLASLTYAPRDQVTAWSRHVLQDARVLSIASVPEPAGDALYLVTERTGPDGTVRRRVERMADRWEPRQGETDARRALYLDAARSRSGPATTQVTGLDHLEGRLVEILADGAVVPSQIVTGGAVKLESAAAIIHVGLPAAWYHETTDIDTGGPIGTGQARPKALTSLHVLVHATVGASVRLIQDGKPAPRATDMQLRRAADPMDTAPQLVSDWVYVDVANSAATSLRLRIEGQSCLPATVLSVALRSTIAER